MTLSPQSCKKKSIGRSMVVRTVRRKGYRFGKKKQKSCVIVVCREIASTIQRRRDFECFRLPLPSNGPGPKHEIRRTTLKRLNTDEIWPKSFFHSRAHGFGREMAAKKKKKREKRHTPFRRRYWGVSRVLLLSPKCFRDCLQTFCGS